MRTLKQITKTRVAENDLVDIWLYSFTEWGEALADDYLDQLNIGMCRLLENPELGMNYILFEGVIGVFKSTGTLCFIALWK